MRLKPIILLLILLIVSGCGKKNSMDEKRTELEKLKKQQTDIEKRINDLQKEIAASTGMQNPENAVHVNLLQVKTETFNRSIDLQGVVESDKAATLSAKIPGPVIGIYVNPGEKVGAGKLLVEIDNDVVKTSAEQLQVQIDFAKTMAEKQKRLFEEKAGSQVQYLQAQTQYESLVKQMASLKEQINNAKIYAPFAGVVDQVFPKVGETVSPGLPVVKLTGMSGIKVTVDVSEAYVSTVKQGDYVSVTLPEIGKTVNGRITAVTKAIDPKNRTFKIDIRLASIPPETRPNMAASVSIKDIVRPDAIVIPLSIVQHEGDKDFVYVIDNNTPDIAKKRYIKTGMVYKDKIEVLLGLSPGDKVITEGAYNVTDGQRVQIEQAM